VRAIENDCAVVPVGAFKLTPTHQLRYNDTFSGLNLEQIGKLTNFQHFRGIKFLKQYIEEGYIILIPKKKITLHH
jgi:hypothetical protein